MKHTTLALIVSAALAGAASARDVVVRLTCDTPEQLQQVESIAASIWNCRYGLGAQIDVRISETRLAEFEAIGLAHTIVVPDVQAVFDAERAEIESRRRLRDITWFENYHTYDEINAYIDQLAGEFPDLVTVRTIGSSLEGRDIRAFDVVSPDAPPDAPVVIFNACQHAREWITPATTMYIADRMLRGYGSDGRITDVVNNVRNVFVPLVNPDGYVYTWNVNRDWRKNRRNNGDGTRGVDNNRNWTEYWGGSGASPYGGSETYRGTAPFSEPETQALRDLALSEPTLAAHVDWHSYGQLLLYPLGGVQAYPPEPDRTFFTTLTGDISDTIWHASAKDYVSEPGFRLYIASGTCSDWFYIVAGVPSWTFELRPEGSPGFVLPPDEIIPTGREMLGAALLLIERSAMPLLVDYPAGHPAYAEPQTPLHVQAILSDSTESFMPGSIAVSWRPQGGSFAPLAASPVGANGVEFWLPPTACGRTVEYTIDATTAQGSSVQFTGTVLAIETTAYLDDDAETDQGWQYGDPGDTGTDGQWERGDPERTLLQPDFDASETGTFCFVTGAAEEGYDLNNDVDGGTISLISPRIDLTGAAAVDPTLSYQRWVYTWINDYFTDDWFRVSISDDDGASWTVIDEPTARKGGWNLVEHRVLDYVAPTSEVRLRFQANDGAADSPVEMAVDDVSIIARVCSGCGPADVTTQGAGSGDPGFGTPDGAVTAADVNYFVNAWVAQELAADLTTQGAGAGDPFFGVPDGAVTAADLQYYINLWVVGCP